MLKTVVNYGVIDVEDGEHGSNSSNASIRGGDGKSGMSLAFCNFDTPTQDQCDNKGIVKVGLGGNAGAGGNISARATIKNTGTRSSTQGEHGTQGAPGEVFAEGNSEIKVGTNSDALKGAIGRLDLNYDYHRLEENENSNEISLFVSTYQTNIYGSMHNFQIENNQATFNYLPIGMSSTMTTSCMLSGEDGSENAEVVIGPASNYKIEVNFTNIFNMIYNLQRSGADADFVPPTS